MHLSVNSIPFLLFQIRRKLGSLSVGGCLPTSLQGPIHSWPMRSHPLILIRNFDFLGYPNNSGHPQCCSVNSWFLHSLQNFGNLLFFGPISLLFAHEGVISCSRLVLFCSWKQKQTPDPANYLSAFPLSKGGKLSFSL